MASKIRDYLVLPPEISDFERTYLHRMNRIVLAFFAIHVPAMAGIALLAGTGAPLAILLTTLALVGPVLAYLTFESPRNVARAYGFTAMVMGGLLVHFGQGRMQIEMHFYFFVLIALLAIFADPLVIIIAAVTVAAHHALLFPLLPRSVFNYDASIWAVAVHALFVVLESVAACFMARSFFDNVIGLDRIVRRRTEELHDRNRDLRLVLDSVGEGFVTIGLDGTMSTERSAILGAWFGPGDGCATIWEYLGHVDLSFGERFALGWEAVVEDMLPLELTLDQMPKRLSAGDRILAIGYRPILEGDALARVLVVISDITAVVERERVEAEQREILQVFERIVHDRAGFVEFFAEATEMTHALSQGGVSDEAGVKRLLHTLKGNCAMFGLRSFAGLCHRIEDRVIDLGELSAADRAELDQSYRWISTRLTSLLGESAPDRMEVDEQDYLEIVRAVVRGEPRAKVLSRLEEWKLDPADRRLARIAEQTKATAERRGKVNVDVVVEANHVRLPREGWGPLWSAFVHTVRNAVDHGVEGEAERLGAGKPGRARIKLSAARAAETITVAIEDDGRGVDWERIAEKARVVGLPSATQADLMEALFADGLSSADETTEHSGRGVGLAAVRAACQALGGVVRISSEPRRGTRVELSLPVRHGVASPQSAGPQTVTAAASF